MQCIAGNKDGSTHAKLYFEEIKMSVRLLPDDDNNDLAELNSSDSDSDAENSDISPSTGQYNRFEADTRESDLNATFEESY